MVMKRLLILFFSIFSLCSCNKGVIIDYYTTCHLVFQNDCSHHIILERTDFSTDSWIRELPKTIALPPKNTYTLQVLSPQLCRVFGKAIFDSKLIVEYDDSKHDSNITKMYNYEFSSKDTYMLYYTYTFTDADYQFALGNGTVLE